MALPQHNEQLPRWLCTPQQQQQQQQQQLPSPFGNPSLQQHQPCLHSFSAQVAAEGSPPSHGVAPDPGLHHGESSGTASSAFNAGLLDFNHAIWQNAKLKASIVCHPLYEDLLVAHLECLRVATPVEQLPRLDEKLATIPQLAAKYSVLGNNIILDAHEKSELDHVMASYILLLQSFKEQLQEHLRGDATQAVLFCCEFEQAFARLTGVAIEEGSGATMSDEEEEYIEDVGAYCYNLNPDFGEEIFPFGPVIPTETEKSILNRVRRDLKLELKQSFRSRIADVREEIMRKRRAGKLPGQTTNILKRWWNAHPKWPYPTEEEKAELVEKTGLELRQINNWFINQRKRNWQQGCQSQPSDRPPNNS